MRLLLTADEAAAHLVKEMARLEIDTLHAPVFTFGPGFLMMVGEHNEDGLCWCQPGVLYHGSSCPGHAVHRDPVH